MNLLIQPTLHDCYQAGNLSGFKELLHPATSNNKRSVTLSSSLSRSPNSRWEHLPPSNAPSSVVNRRDLQGRTVLHLAVSKPDERNLEFVHALLAVTTINVNLQDFESGWTALHRAFYVGNLVAARAIASRTDCDTSIKDNEGLAPADLWNATIDGTSPADSPLGRQALFTWGTNRNFVLGIPGDGDRPLPEKVSVRAKQPHGLAENAQKILLQAPNVQEIVMAKLHTAILTDEKVGNTRLCGFGSSSGRLGQSGRTQFAFEPLGGMTLKVASVALGLDHTVLLTDQGDVYTFGLNHHGQLGYALDPPAKGASEEPIQLSPRRVHALRKDTVKGIAASRYHTACYTSDSLMTWGAPRGQLGYATNATQVLPRRVAAVPAPIIQITATEFATVCLLDTAEVFVCFNNAYFKMVFPVSRFATEMSVYRPPTATPKPAICKISANGSEFLAVSSIGDVYNWTLDDSVTDTTAASRSPSRLWNLRKSPSGVVDAAIGPEAAVVCTRSGHVFVKQRRVDNPSKQGDARVKVIGLGNNASSASTGRRNLKFHRVPFLQRVTKVASNGTGGFAAIRSDVAVHKVSTAGSDLAADFLTILPHWHRCCSAEFIADCPTAIPAAIQNPQDPDYEDEEEQHISRDLNDALRLSRALELWDASWSSLLFGADLLVEVQGKRIAVHSAIIASRSPVLNDILRSKQSSTPSGITYTASFPPVLAFKHCSSYTALLLLHYIYSDSFPCIWDARVALGYTAVRDRLAFGTIKDELQRLAHILQLPALGKVCGRSEKLSPSETLPIDTLALKNGSTCAISDVLINLSDTSLACHSVVLRSRCPFFTALFDDDEWLAERRASASPSQEVEIDLAHIPFEVFEPIIRHIYSDTEDLFNSSSFASSDAFIDYIFSVIAVTNELLLDRLKAICSNAIIPFIDLRNACAVYQDADFYEARLLADRCAHYLCCNMETVFENHYLSDLPKPLLVKLAAFSRTLQSKKFPMARSGELVHQLLAQHFEYFAELDLAKQPIGQARRIRTLTNIQSSTIQSSSPSSYNWQGLSPPSTDFQYATRPSERPSPRPSPLMTAVAESFDDEHFQMDDLDLDHPETSSTPTTPLKKAGWGLSTERPSISPVSLRQVLSETPATRKIATTSGLPSTAAGPAFRAVSQKDRRKAAQVAEEPVLSPARYSPVWPSPSSSTAPTWRVPTATPTKSSLAAIQSQQTERPPTPTSTSSALTPSTSRPAPSPRMSSPAVRPVQDAKASPADASSAIGAPIISPVRMQSASGSGRGSSVKWGNYSSTSSFFSPAATSPSAEAEASFAYIQSQQHNEGEMIRNAKKAPKSLADIQQEEAFMTWWAEEERRAQEAEAAASRPPTQPRGRGGKGPRGRGKGRGRGKTDGPPVPKSSPALPISSRV